MQTYALIPIQGGMPVLPNQLVIPSWSANSLASMHPGITICPPPVEQAEGI